MSAKSHSVKQVAAFSGLTVRTLHHYDAIGLLTPQRSAKGGYRRYSDADVLLLQQILVYRRLGFPLELIAKLVHDPQFDRQKALSEQRDKLAAQLAQTHSMLRAVDAALDAHRTNTMPKPEILFDGFDPSHYEEEARERWGDTDAYQQSARRTRGYSDADWAEIKAASDDLLRRICACMQGGAPAHSPAAVALAEEHRLQIDRYYYPCSRAMHRNLAQLYTDDERFTANLDRFGDGTAAFLAASIVANAGA